MPELKLARIALKMPIPQCIPTLIIFLLRNNDFLIRELGLPVALFVT